MMDWLFFRDESPEHVSTVNWSGMKVDIIPGSPPLPPPVGYLELAGGLRGTMKMLR